MNVNSSGSSNYYPWAETSNETKQNDNQAQSSEPQRQPSWIAWASPTQPTVQPDTNIYPSSFYHSKFSQQAVTTHHAGGTGISGHTVVQPRLPSAIADYNYSDAIDHLLLRSSIRSDGEIISRVNIANEITTMRDSPDGTKKLCTEAPDDDRNGSIFEVDGNYNLINNTYYVKYTERENFPQLNISDALLAQLGRVMPSDHRHLPISLPTTVVRYMITNDIAQEVIDGIYAHSQTPADQKINISLRRSEPKSVENSGLLTQRK